MIRFEEQLSSIALTSKTMSPGAEQNNFHNFQKTVRPDEQNAISAE